MKLQTAAAAPVVKPADNLREKRLAALVKAREAKKAKAAEVKPASKPKRKGKAAAVAVAGDGPTFTGNGQSVTGFTGTNKKGVNYKGVRFADKYGRSFVCTLAEYHALSCVIRSNADSQIREWLK